MQQELVLRKDYLTDKCLESIYFGGGTPSLLSLEELQHLFSSLHANFALSDNVEITLEANPDDITEENLANWRKVGINRLSIGLQSFKEKDLNWMNRAHSVQDALKCVELAKSHGFENISVDLIYGLPELTLEEWKQHITLVLGMHVQHISAYCLTI